MKLLITGFEPFGAVKVNPSWEVAKHIALSPKNGVVVCAKLLPVSFDKAGSVLLEAVNQFAPDVVIMLGVATKRAVISYERVAINIDESSKADNDGKLCSGTPIRLNGPTAFFSNLPIKEMREATILAGIAAEVSNSAGTYVCNHTMYECLYHIDQSGLNIRAGFVHLPQFQANGPMGLDEMVKAISIALETIIRNEQKN